MNEAQQLTMSQGHKVNLELFEGPLDLLLHLIRKSDLDIYHIPIAPILDEYLAYLDLMRELDIDLAGDFILMAAELAHIKGRMVLDQEGDEEEEPDPRADLIARLLEYQKFKNASQWLLQRPLLNRDIFRRQDSAEAEELAKEAEKTAQTAPPIPVGLEVDPIQLLRLFHEVMKKVPKGTVVEMEGERISITDRIYQVWDFLASCVDGAVSFEKLFDGDKRKGDIVLTFLAILEMARLRMIRIFQESPGGEIIVKKAMAETGEI